MTKKSQNSIRSDLSDNGRRLLQLIADQIHSAAFVAGDPRTYLGYKECCVALGVAPADADVPWGRLLQKHGLNDLNGWTQRHGFARVTGLIVNQAGDRQYCPGGDYFASNGRPDMDGPWWEDQARQAGKFDWQPFL